MKKNVFRTAAIAAVGGLLIAAVAPLSAFAATVPPYDGTTDKTVYVLDGADLSNIASGAQLDWNPANGIIMSAAPSPANLGDYSWSTFGPVTGATYWTQFVALPGQERTPTSWKEFGDLTTIDTGVSLPQVAPGSIPYGTPVKTAGGTYSMGIAFTDGNALASTHVIKAYYTTINVDSGIGSWTFAAQKPPVVNTDIATTTTLAASPTSVEVGSTTVLTATVGASKALPASNVEFYNGTTKLGTGAVANNQASYTATVGTVGANTFSAKYVENVVSTGATTTDTFKASTSADVIVTAPAPAVPQAPSENALDASNTQTATYSATTDTAQLGPVGVVDGTKVYAFGYSTHNTPMYLGEYSVGGTVIVANVSGLPAGTLKVAAVNETTNQVLAWGSFAKTTAGPSISKAISANVATLVPTDGEFSLTNLSGAVVNLTNPTIVNGQSVVSGQLGDFQVTDLRQVSKAGWSLGTTVTSFVKGSDTIANTALGIAPKTVSQLGSGATAPTTGAATVSGSAVYPWDFAALAAGGFSGYTKYNADLVFTAPTGSPAGTYTSTLTLTLLSK